ncbi:MAG: PAS domain-containing protein [Melioribacteraceae bacterium]|nr:PAS domain-containing protein [Melioribacteraceae bacterium]
MSKKNNKSVQELQNELENLQSKYENLIEKVRILEYKEYLLSIILNNIPQAVYLKDKNGVYTGASKSLAKKFGLSDPDHLIGSGDSSFYSEEYSNDIHRKENQTIKSGKPIIDFETEETWLDGTKTYAINSLIPLFNKESEINSILGISSDITKQKETEFALQNNINFLEVLINTLPTPIYYKDTSGCYQGCNEAFVELVGIERQELIGRNASDIFPKELAEFFAEKDKELFNSNVVQQFDVSIPVKDNSFYDAICYQASFLNYDGSIVGLVGGLVDIQDRKVAEEKLAAYMDELQRTNYNKDRFFSIIAHDLKNPFITLLGYTEALMEDYNEMNAQEHIEYLTQIRNTSKNSYQLLENLLQWSRSQSGKLQIEQVNFYINEVVDEVLSLTTSSSDSKKIRVSKDINSELTVYADKDMVKTILRNLITNAIKFTSESGRIIISGEAKNNFVEISVEDNGIGIDESDMNNLFNIENFRSKAGTNNETGTGLGLILCNEFVQKNNGNIKVESKPGEGSRFTFSLPCNP